MGREEEKKDKKDQELEAAKDVDKENGSKEEMPEKKEAESKSEAEGKKEETDAEVSDEAKKDESEEKAEENKEKKSEDKKEDFKELEGETPYVDPLVEKYKGKKSKTKKVIKYVALSILGLIALVYIGGVIFFAFHFDGNTYINEYDVSWKNKKEVQAIFDKEFADYELQVVFKNGVETIGTDDGVINVKLQKNVSELKNQQNPFLWFVNIFNDESYRVDYVVEYDDHQLNEFIDGFDYMKPENMEESVDAYVKLQDGEVVVVPDITGTKVNPEKVYETIKNALAVYDDSVELEYNDCYVLADITKDSPVIAGIVEKADKYLSINAYYDFNGYKLKLSKEDLTFMGYIDSTGNVSISKTNVTVFANNLAQEYSTCYTDRKFRTHDGKTILIYGGNFGWLLDAEKEAEELYELMLTKNNFMKEPACIKKGYTFCDMNDIGKNYVEIDLADQKVYIVKDGVVTFEADCVSGHEYGGHHTPGGLFDITYKEMYTVLVGPDWNSPVTFWLPFNGQIGLHDASWRYTFGGDIYLWNGSHGCVNLSYNAAKEIYNFVEIGTPVVAYWDYAVEVIEE